MINLLKFVNFRGNLLDPEMPAVANIFTSSGIF